ncbi:MAG: benzoate-CoA ligase family protein [Longimicrobiales bacterium]
MIPRKAADLPVWYNAVDILERNLEHRADAQALITAERKLTFGQVSAEVNRVGNAMKALGVRPGDRVAILCLDCAEWAISFFACLKIGAVAVGMNTLLTARELRHILIDSDARVLLVHSALREIATESMNEDTRVEHIVVVAHDDALDLGVTYEEWIADESEQLAAERVHRDDFGTLNYSSGTTGQPKGIFHAHRDYALTAQLWGADVLGLSQDDRTFSVAKLFFTFGLGGNLLFPWWVGASVVLYPGSPRQAADVLGVIDRFRPTILYNAPTGYASILAIDDFTERYDLSSLRLGVSAGEALPAPVWQAFNERTGLDIIDGIGSTENFHIFISNRPGDIRPGSSGKPVPGYECRIVDDEGVAVETGDVGTLQIKGETAALFYLHQSERSREVFQGEWLDTGDKYYEDEDGYFWHAGRSDDMLKVGGIWVSPVEVESTLIEHDAVLECAVVGVEDNAGLVKPKAFVVLHEPGGAGDDMVDRLVEHCVDRMAAYKRPRWIEFVDQLPKTATGKIQRFRLR